MDGTKQLNDRIVELTAELNTLEKEIEAVARTRNFYRDIIRKYGYEDKLPSTHTKEMEEVISRWNTLFEDNLTVKVKLTDTLSQALTDRLNSYPKDVIMTAMQNRYDYVTTSEWHVRPENSHHMTNIMLLMGTDFMIERALNFVKEDPERVDHKKQTVKIQEDRSDKTILE